MYASRIAGARGGDDKVFPLGIRNAQYEPKFGGPQYGAFEE
jgi:hypothetical protein